MKRRSLPSWLEHGFRSLMLPVGGAAAVLLGFRMLPAGGEEDLELATWRPWSTASRARQ
jgi:hypothetical protein